MPRPPRDAAGAAADVTSTGAATDAVGCISCRLSGRSACRVTKRPIFSPIRTPISQPVRKWMPPYTRASAASCAACDRRS
jgi:hypothetical protein